jgi:NAD(P)-dependent dehydrogenase (short-subunit alcohol dehydrogenase family)
VRVIRIDVPGPGEPISLDAYTPEQWRQAVARVLGASIESAQEAVLELLGEGGGCVLFAVPAVTGDAAWRAGVAGVQGLARSIAKEYGRKRIRCNVLVGECADMERLLTGNEAITGEWVDLREDVCE